MLSEPIIHIYSQNKIIQRVIECHTFIVNSNALTYVICERLHINLDQCRNFKAMYVLTVDKRDVAEPPLAERALALRLAAAAPGLHGLRCCP